MFNRNIRLLANKLGFDIHKFSATDWRWSYDVDDYYPVEAQPRWGHGKPVHPELYRALNAGRSDYADLLKEMEGHKELLSLVPAKASDGLAPYWTNGWFRDFDAGALVTLLATKRPRRYFEIGSGNSTKFARFAVNAIKSGTEIVSLDPAPRGEVDDICDRVIRERLERSDLSIFNELEPGDFLFFDGSHRVFPNSDTTVFFLELLPRLKPGVIVHIHDILLPSDYLPMWNRRMYSEQYILAAMLLSPVSLFKTIMPNYFVCADPDLGEQVGSILSGLPCNTQGWSFWLQKT